MREFTFDFLYKECLFYNLYYCENLVNINVNECSKSLKFRNDSKRILGSK